MLDAQLNERRRVDTADCDNEDQVSAVAVAPRTRRVRRHQEQVSAVAVAPRARRVRRHQDQVSAVAVALRASRVRRVDNADCDIKIKFLPRPPCCVALRQHARQVPQNVQRQVLRHGCQVGHVLEC